MVCNCDTTGCTYPTNLLVSRCTGKCLTNSITTQKQIWNQVRVPSSLYMMNKAAFIIGSNRLKKTDNNNNIILKGNQSSDQNTLAIQIIHNATHGNSLKSTLTSLKPGAGAPGGTGVDIKHNSYARYLGRKKSSNIKSQTVAVSTPKHGNKIQMFGLVMNSETCIC